MACAMTDEESAVRRYENLQEQLEEIVKCPVCKERCSNPKILPCTHSFCVLCIDRVFRRTNRNCAPCPVCREDFFPAERDVANFRNNVHVQAILDVLNTQEKFNSNHFQTCGACQAPGSKVTHICVDCKKKICRKCIELHNQFTKSHVVLLLSEINGTPIKDVLEKNEHSKYCKMHPTSFVEYHCITCDLTICSSCESSDHLNHEKRRVDVAAKEVRTFLESTITKLEPIVSDKEHKFTYLKEHRQRGIASHENAKKQMKDFAFKCKNNMVEKEKSCEDSIEEVFSANDKKIQDLIAEAEIQNVKGTKTLAYIKALKDFGNDVQLVQQKRSVLRKVEQIDKQEVTGLPSAKEFLVSFQPNRSLLLTLTAHDGFGSVKTHKSTYRRIQRVSPDRSLRQSYTLGGKPGNQEVGNSAIIAAAPIPSFVMKERHQSAPLLGMTIDENLRTEDLLLASLHHGYNQPYPTQKFADLSQFELVCLIVMIVILMYLDFTSLINN